jgi:hypothetical protein
LATEAASVQQRRKLAELLHVDSRLPQAYGCNIEETPSMGLHLVKVLVKNPDGESTLAFTQGAPP